MIPAGTLPTTDSPTPELPAVLPGLAGLNLLAALSTEERRLRFLAEHINHPAVSEGVADAIHDAHQALDAARRLQADLCWGVGL